MVLLRTVNTYLMPVAVWIVEAQPAGLECLAAAASLPGLQPNTTLQAEAAKPRRMLHRHGWWYQAHFGRKLQRWLFTFTAPEQIEKMQPGFYLPVLLHHRGLQVAYPVQESTTWPRLACFVKRVPEFGQITDAAATLLGAMLMLPERNVVVIVLPDAQVHGMDSERESVILQNDSAMLRNQNCWQKKKKDLTPNYGTPLTLSR